jgi:hypothetical protein
MSLDDLFLLLQSLVDRAVRRVRLGRAPRPGQRRFLIVQIDGLSRSVLEQALAERRMPFLGRLLERRGFRLRPMSVGMPTSTPAFQMALMYGVRPDIPAFHYHDKRRRVDIYFPRAGHAAGVETAQAAGRTGILRDGSTYGCVFTGGAADNLWSFARISRPTGDGVLRAVSSGVVLLWGVVKALTFTTLIILRSLLRFIADPVREGARGWRWLLIKLGISVWMRELFTLAVARDLYRGVPAVYVNYLDYDVFAHAFGPHHPAALRALRRIDRSLRQLWRVLRRVPEYRYDLYILSDHGQAACRPFARLHAGRPLERILFDELLAPPAPSAPPQATDGAGEDGGRRRSLRHASREFRRGLRELRHQREPGLFQRFVNYLEEDFLWLLGQVRPAREQRSVRVVSAGPNALLYCVDAAEPLCFTAVEDRLPGLAKAISETTGVGFVLARDESGPLCWWRGARYRLGRAEPGPFAGREDLDLVLQGIRDLMDMPSAGDLVIYGIGAPGGHVSFLAEIGAHAGPSPEELHTFIVHPPDVELPASITHPAELYPHFVGYQAGA